MELIINFTFFFQVFKFFLNIEMDVVFGGGGVLFDPRGIEEAIF